jgi:hypothetical protein
MFLRPNHNNDSHIEFFLKKNYEHINNIFEILLFNFGILYINIFIDILIKSLYSSARSSDDLNNAFLISINRNTFIHKLHHESIKYSHIGYDDVLIDKNIKKMLLILDDKKIIIIKKIITKKGNLYKTNNLLIFDLKYINHFRIMNIQYSTIPYKLKKICGRYYYHTYNFDSLSNILITSPKNRNIVVSNINSAIKLSSTPLKINKKYMKIVEKELLLELKSIYNDNIKLFKDNNIFNYDSIMNNIE